MSSNVQDGRVIQLVFSERCGRNFQVIVEEAHKSIFYSIVYESRVAFAKKYIHKIEGIVK